MLGLQVYCIMLLHHILFLFLFHTLFLFLFLYDVYCIIFYFSFQGWISSQSLFCSQNPVRDDFKNIFLFTHW